MKAQLFLFLFVLLLPGLELKNVVNASSNVCLVIYGCYDGCYHAKKKTGFNWAEKGRCRKSLKDKKDTAMKCNRPGDIWCGPSQVLNPNA